jgi:hypothetical protein
MYHKPHTCDRTRHRSIHKDNRNAYHHEKFPCQSHGPKSPLHQVDTERPRGNSMCSHPKQQQKEGWCIVLLLLLLSKKGDEPLFVIRGRRKKRIPTKGSFGNQPNKKRIMKEVGRSGNSIFLIAWIELLSGETNHDTMVPVHSLSPLRPIAFQCYQVLPSRVALVPA